MPEFPIALRAIGVESLERLLPFSNSQIGKANLSESERRSLPFHKLLGTNVLQELRRSSRVGSQRGQVTPCNCPNAFLGISQVVSHARDDVAHTLGSEPV